MIASDYYRIRMKGRKREAQIEFNINAIEQREQEAVALGIDCEVKFISVDYFMVTVNKRSVSARSVGGVINLLRMLIELRESTREESQ